MTIPKATVEAVMAAAEKYAAGHHLKMTTAVITDAAEAETNLRSLAEALAVDAERLDWLIAQQAWIQWTVRDGSIRQCQVYDQDEDENYLILSGADRYFNTPREAIDAAISSTEPPHAVD
jgi:hypothetical protein